MEDKKNIKKTLWIGVVAYAVVILTVLTIANIDAINNFISSIFAILRPVIVGLVLAYVCNPFFRLYERKIFFRLHPPKLRRALSLTCAILSVFFILGFLLLMILPQFFSSLTTFIVNYKSYFDSALLQINELFEQINGLLGRLTNREIALLKPLTMENLPAGLVNLFEQGASALPSILEGLNIAAIVAWLGEAVSAVTDFILGLFIAIYLLTTKEQRAAQLMKLRRAIFGERVNSVITRVVSTANRCFGSFFIGKLLDSLLIALLTYIVTSIFRIPYALLVSILIGLTSIIPIFGILIGTIPAAFIILLVEPKKILAFILIMVVIQLIDSNIIAPKILGRNTGVSSLCVIIAISFMGALWGLAGMILGVPLFATILEISEIYIIERLQKKGLPSGLANYYAPDTVVDPKKDIESNTDKLFRSFERAYLRIKKQLEHDISAPLTKRQRLCLKLYDIGLRLRLIEPADGVALIELSADEALREAEESSAETFDTFGKAPENADSAQI